MAMEPVEYPVTDVLDLHTFQPKEIPDLLDEYFRVCIEKRIFQVRVIHGKGTGVLKKRVYGVLRKNPKVASFNEAPAGAGGWGAVLVCLRREDE